MYTIEVIVEKHDWLLEVNFENLLVLFERKIEQTMVENQNHIEKMMHQNTLLVQEEIQAVDIVNLFKTIIV
jgi:hypothetical protein